MTTTALVLAGRSLIVRDQQPELIDVTLDKSIIQTIKEVEELETEIDGTEAMVGRSLNQLAFRYPELCEEFRKKVNKFRQLQGELPIPKDIDPASMANKDMKNPDEDAIKAEKEAEAAAKKAIDDLDDSELTPSMKKAKLAVRMRKEKCKRFYALIAQKTHPDKVKDFDLNKLFIEAKKAYEELDLDILKQMHKDLKAFLRMRGKKGKYRDFKMMRLREVRDLRDNNKKRIKSLKSSLAYTCYTALNSGDPFATREAYMEFIAEQIIRLDESIEGLREQLYMQRRRKLADTLFADLT